MARGPWHEEVDVIVVGASVGGLLAAVLSADRGLRVAVLERTKELGGSAGTEAEYVAAAGTRVQRDAGIADSADRLAADIVAHSQGLVALDEATPVAAEGAAVVGWLEDRCGLKTELVVGGTGHSATRLVMPSDRGGPTLVEALSRAATRSSRVTIRTGTAAAGLVRGQAGAVEGVALRAERRGGPQTVTGRVLLACGGFAGDDALVGAHCPAVASLPHHGARPATGDGLRLAREAGAEVRRLEACPVTPFLAMPGGLSVDVPLPALGAILVDQAGRPLGDARADGLVLAGTVRRALGHLAYLVFDERIAAEARDADPFFARVVLPRAGRRASTIADLARQLEIDLAGLEQTMEGVARFEPTFHAIRVTGARRRTLGGVVVDAAARALDPAGQPIPGLYATGGVAAGLAGPGVTGALPGVETLTTLARARLAALDLVASQPPEAA